MTNSDMQSALANLEAAWNAAAKRFDPAGLVSLYTDNAVFYGGRPGHSVGRLAVRAYFDSYIGEIESAPLRLVDQHLIAIGPDAFVAQGLGEFSFTLSGGRHARSTLRTTLVVVRTDGGWRILQHHFSATPDSPPLGT
jgi:uncharacterized protein (TIGR02246 family)